MSPQLLSTVDENWDANNMKGGERQRLRGGDEWNKENEGQFEGRRDLEIEKQNFKENWNVQNVIKLKQEEARKETEQKFKGRIVELERRSQYLDRSLELIEEMKSKFEFYE